MADLGRDRPDDHRPRLHRPRRVRDPQDHGTTPDRVAETRSGDDGGRRPRHRHHPLISEDANKALVRRFYTEAINERDPTACERLLAENFVHNEEPRGRAGQAETVAYFLNAFPDLHNSIELLLAEGDLVCAHQRWRGTHEGEFLGVEATGKIVDFTSTAVLRIEDDLIAQAWDEVDSLAFLRQVGRTPG